MQTKRTKVIRYRGSKTHGCGSMKKRRGAGNRGGRGNAGSGKRADQNKPKIWKNQKYFGKHGFHPPNKQIVQACNLRFLEEQFDSLLLLGKIKEEKGSFVIDLASIGFDKLLSAGNVTRKYNILVAQASARVAEKVEKVGGTLVLGGKSPAENVAEENTKKVAQKA